MTQTGTVTKQRKFTGWHMATIMGLFFGTIITVNLTMAWFANSSWTGLVVKNSYVASQHFNEVTAEKRRQAALGWRSTVSYEAEQLDITLSDASGNIISDAIVTAKVGHPANEQHDQQLQLTESATGTYSVSTELVPGLWQADISATGPNGNLWTKSYRFLVKG